MRQLLQATFRKLTRVKPLDFSSTEERLQGYHSKNFYPVKLGEIFHDTDQVVWKVGLVAIRPSGLLEIFSGACLDDIELPRHSFKDRYAVLKVCTNDIDWTEEAHHELRLSRHIAAAKPGHLGLKHIRTVQDSFKIQGPLGPHLCLVYQLMREPLWLLQRRMSGGVYSLDLLGYTVKFLLIGLVYLHNECKVIHTDLKLENVLVGLEKSLSLDDIVGDEIKSPSPGNVLPDRTIYLSQNDFGHPKSTPGRPDFDAAILVTSSQKTFNYPIQPNCYRAPEAILGAPWSYPADIWNLGAMLWDLLEGKALFDGADSAHGGEYTSRAHLAQLIGLLGSPPKELLARGTKSSLHFNASGEFMAPRSIPCRTLFDTVTTIDGEEIEQFLRSTSRMLQWLPESRATAQ
ncbi:kinase-like protein [Phlegmacium glaucopus]|nr:kinase-like protein [Phlegmacium glaucopus]